MIRRTHKYNAIKTRVDGFWFHSGKEAERYKELKLLQQSKNISGLDLQKKFEIKLNGKKICNYFLDFFYVDEKLGEIYEDVKGFRTPIYRLKKKLVEAQFGIVITET